MRTLTEFTLSLKSETPPDYIIDKPAFKALWLASTGQWEQAHALTRTLGAEEGGAWLHACLHRIEGDTNNANYWYHRAEMEYYSGDTSAELEEIAIQIFNSSDVEE